MKGIITKHNEQVILNSSWAKSISPNNRTDVRITQQSNWVCSVALLQQGNYKPGNLRDILSAGKLFYPLKMDDKLMIFNDE